MNQYLIKIFLILILLNSYHTAQIDSLKKNYEENILILNNLDDLNEENNLSEYIEDLKQNKIDINKSDINDLLKVPFLNYSQSEKIINFRNNTGSFFSINELRQLLDDQTFILIKDFVTVKSGKRKTKKLKNEKDFDISFRSSIIKPLKLSKGFESGYYTGSNYKNNTRLLLSYKSKYNFGFMTDKDFGEKNLTDYYSAHISINDFYKFEKLIFGDYYIKFGRGLSYFSPYYFSSSISMSSLFSNYFDIRENTSLHENKMMRGFAALLNSNQFEFMIFTSHNNYDARIDSVSENVQSIRNDGYHRSLSEISYKNPLYEKSYGLSLKAELNKQIQFGYLFSLNNYNYLLNGNKNTYLNSISYSSNFNKIFLSGEFAYQNNNYAHSNSVGLNISENITYYINYTYFSQNYFSFHSYSNSLNDLNNESSFTNSIHFNTLIGKVIGSFILQNKFGSAESNLFDNYKMKYLLNFNSKLNTNTEVNLQYVKRSSQITKYLNNRVESGTKNLHSIKLNLANRVSKNIYLQSKINYNLLNEDLLKNSETGHSISQEIIYKVNFIQINAKYIFYNSDSYDTKIYEYERDLPGVFSIGPYFEEGTKWYVYTRLNITQNLNLYFKYYENYKPGKMNLGTAYNEIEGNLDNRISFQIQYKY